MEGVVLYVVHIGERFTWVSYKGRNSPASVKLVGFVKVNSGDTLYWTPDWSYYVISKGSVIRMPVKRIGYSTNGSKIPQDVIDTMLSETPITKPEDWR